MMVFCKKCGYNHEWNTSKYNTFFCGSCHSINWFTREGQHFGKKNIIERKFLNQQFKDLTIEFDAHRPISVDGIIEFSYNEANALVFYLADIDNTILVHFDYTWYKAQLNEKLRTYKDKLVTSGAFLEIDNEQYYVVHRETVKHVNVIGQACWPIDTDTSMFAFEGQKDQLSTLFFGISAKAEFQDNICFSLGLEALHDVKCNHEILIEPFNFTCEKCNRTNKIVGFPSSRSYACSCFTQYGFTSNRSIIKYKKFNDDGIAYHLPLHMVGNIDGVDYTIIGRLVKQDENFSIWEEYTLFNKELGYKFLSIYASNYVLFDFFKPKEPVDVIREDVPNWIMDGNDKFKIFNDYKSKVILAEGEFAGDIFNDKDYQNIEFIAPPQIISYEQPIGESISILKGRQLTRTEMNDIFGQDHYFGLPTEVVGSSPYLDDTPFRKILYIFASIFCTYLALQYFIGKRSVTAEKISFSPTVRPTSNADLGLAVGATRIVSAYDFGQISLDDKAYISDSAFVNDIGNTVHAVRFNSNEDSIKYKSINRSNSGSIPFEIKSKRAAIEINLAAMVFDSWVDFDMEIVNQTTGESFSKNLAAEYYSGFEDGESWSEGSQTASIVFGGLERGKYTLNYTGTTGMGRVFNADLLLQETSYLSSNFWWGFWALLIPLGIYIFVYYSRESMRWKYSKYAINS